MLSLQQANKTIEEKIKQKPGDVDKNWVRDILYQLSYQDRFYFLEKLPTIPNMKKKVTDDIFRYIMSPAGLLCEIPENDIDNWLKYLLFESLTEQFNETQTKELIKHAIKKWPSAIKAISTHQAKLADPKSRTSFYAPVKQRNSTLPYVCSSTLNTFAKKVSITSSSKAIFIETEFIYKGKVINIIDSLLNEDLGIKSSMINIGFTKSQVDFLTDNAKQNINNDNKLLGDFPQTCFPIDDNCKRYLNITSLPAIAVVNQINLRLKNRFIEKNDPVFTITCKIGGTKPQNSGTYNLSIGGHQRHLRSTLPFKRNKSILEKSLRRACRTKTLFNFYIFDWSFLEKTHLEAKNEVMKKFLCGKICLILDSVCSTYDALRYHALWEKQTINVYEKAINLLDILELKYAHSVLPGEPLLSKMIINKAITKINATDKKNLAKHIQTKLIEGIKIDTAAQQFNIADLLQTTIEKYLFSGEVLL